MPRAPGRAATATFARTTSTRPARAVLTERTFAVPAVTDAARSDVLRPSTVTRTTAPDPRSSDAGTLSVLPAGSRTLAVRLAPAARAAAVRR